MGTWNWEMCGDGDLMVIQFGTWNWDSDLMAIFCGLMVVLDGL